MTIYNFGSQFTLFCMYFDILKEHWIKDKFEMNVKSFITLKD